jgi:hypothetical protein
MYGERFAGSLARHTVITPDMGVDLVVDFASSSAHVDSSDLGEDAFAALRTAIEKAFPGALTESGAQSVTISFGAPCDVDIVPALYTSDGPSQRFVQSALAKWNPSTTVALDGLDEVSSSVVDSEAIISAVRQVGSHGTQRWRVSPLWIVAILTALRSAALHVQRLHVCHLRLRAARALTRKTRTYVSKRSVAASPSKPRGPNSAIYRLTGRGTPVLV